MKTIAATMFLGNIGATELIIILVIILVLFGASKIPQLARGLGKGVSEFKKGLKEGEDETKNKDQSQKSADQDNKNLN